ncbi:MAG: PAS domain-containing protein [Pseudomonadota bacterium]|nr:PAS domain-containing protein [Pseudomonadota bacterium]
MSSEPQATPRIYAISALVAAIVLGGMRLVAHFTSAELGRDLDTWQEKLNLIAESRASDVDRWVEGQFSELRSLADNPSLQMYMTELQMQPDGRGGDSAQKVYLRNLVLFTAARAGFGAGNAAASIPANVQPESKSGLAVINAKREIAVSTLIEPGMRDIMMEQAAQAPAGHEKLIDLRKDKDGTPYIGFVVPVYSIQGEHNAASQIGGIIGVKTVDDNLFKLLKHPGTTEHSLEILLARRGGNTIDYLSPLMDGTAALTKQIPFDPAKSAEAQLMQTTGNFTSEKPDYRGNTVLATSRAIAGTPWTLIVKIDRQEALAASEQYRNGMVALFFLSIAVIVLILIAIWWYAHSKRSMMLSHHFRKLAAQTAAQERMLRLVSDHQPEAVYIIDVNYTYRFANQQAASAAGMSPESVVGKTLVDQQGAALAEKIEKQCAEALQHGQVIYETHAVYKEGEEHVIRSAYVPLAHIPLAALPKPTPGVLIVEQDISDAVHERERRLATLRQLVDMLLRLVDRRDPFAANHSQLVAGLAQETAAAMQLSPVLVETARIAGSLMNVGKIVVPPELLTKTDPLSPEEKRNIHDSMNAAAELIENIQFDGPVVETLRQWQEKWDGTGPLALSDDAILITARVIAAANAFVGMISPRSWRTAMSIEDATRFMLDQSDKAFDRRVVVALINYIENQSGRAWVRHVLEHNQAA